MYGDGWFFENGKGSLSGGGGANGEWEWGDIDEPVRDYTYECASDMPYLGLIYDSSIVSDEHTFKVLMKKTTEPDIGNFKTSGSPATLDFNRTGGGASEEVIHDYLPIPDSSFASSEQQSYSAYTSTTQWRMVEFYFDSAYYYVPYPCFLSYDDTVRETRGATYIESLTLGQNYAGWSKLWQFYYQSNLVEETEFPGGITIDDYFPAIINGFPPAFVHGGLMAYLMNTYGVRRVKN